MPFYRPKLWKTLRITSWSPDNDGPLFSTFRRKVWNALLILSWSQLTKVTKKCSAESVGNRLICTLPMPSGFEYTFTIRDTHRQDAYSREELFRMLRTIREHEHRMGWRVPENPAPFKNPPSPTKEHYAGP